MHRHQGEDQVHLMEPGKRKLRSYADRQMLLPAWALRIRRLCAQTPTSTTETLFAHEQRDHRSLPISGATDAPPDPHCSRTLRKIAWRNLFAPFLCGARFLDKSGAEVANELCLNFRHFDHVQTNRLRFESIITKDFMKKFLIQKYWLRENGLIYIYMGKYDVTAVYSLTSRMFRKIIGLDVFPTIS